VIRVRREIVLATEDIDPHALLVDEAPEIQYAWAHRLLDPLKLELLDAKRTDVAMVAESDDVAVFAVPLALRKAIVGLAPDATAWQTWLAHEDVQFDQVTTEEARELHDIFKKLALMSAIGGGDAYVRVWFRQLGVY
jgi:hypothetical protein